MMYPKIEIGSALKSLMAGVLLFASSGCQAPWRHEKEHEINLSFRIVKNQLHTNAVVGGKPGSFLIGTSQARSLVSTEFLRRHRMKGKETVRILLGRQWSREVTPVEADLQGIADGILGADLWDNATVTIDYRRKIFSRVRGSRFADDLVSHRFSQAPTLPVEIEGVRYSAIVDTTIPDALILPQSIFGGVAGSHRAVRVRVGNAERRIEGYVSAGEQVRIGNLLLGNYLVMIDYRSGVVGLWPDPREEAAPMPRRKQ